MRLAEIAQAVGGRLHQATGEELVTASVEFDSRAVRPGGLFLALPGEHADGHDFAAAAMAAGAAGILAGRPGPAPAVVAPAAPAGAAAGASYLLAADRNGSGAAVLAALARLAAHVLRSADVSAVVGVTGSSGKTSTKDLLAAVLSPLGPTVAPPGSFNNELGHPWTVLRVDEHTRHLVLELSARGPGDIAALCRAAPPRIGVVLNVGRAHLGQFGSIDAVTAAKGELVQALPAARNGGLAVLNADDPNVAAMARRTLARVIMFGQSASAEIRAHDVTLDSGGRARFRLSAPVGQADVALQLVGPHQVGNALAAAAVALELGAGVEQVAAALNAAGPVSRWRMEVTERQDGVTVVNDAYNANPESMRAAVHALVAIASGARGRPRRRSWAVLGEMAELGTAGADAHSEIAELAAASGVDRLVSVATRGYGPGAEYVPDASAALDLLHAELRPGDVVLVKASRAVGLDRVAAGLLAASGPAQPSPPAVSSRTGQV